METYRRLEEHDQTATSERPMLPTVRRQTGATKDRDSLKSCNPDQAAGDPAVSRSNLFQETEMNGATFRTRSP
jgi:hypothetical protein